MSDAPALLQAALNGARRRDDHPAIPTSAGDIATLVAAARGIFDA